MEDEVDLDLSLSVFGDDDSNFSSFKPASVPIKKEKGSPPRASSYSSDDELLSLSVGTTDTSNSTKLTPIMEEDTHETANSHATSIANGN